MSTNQHKSTNKHEYTQTPSKNSSPMEEWQAKPDGVVSSFLKKLLDGAEVAWLPLGDITGGEV